MSRDTVSMNAGIDPGELSYTPQPPGIASLDRYMLCIATHNQKKALDVLIKAFALLTEKDPTLGLVLVGDGPLRRQHEELGKVFGLNGRIQFLGWRGRTGSGNLAGQSIERSSK